MQARGSIKQYLRHALHYRNKEPRHSVVLDALNLVNRGRRDGNSER